MMENFKEDFDCVSANLNEDVKLSILASYKQFSDAMRPFKGKNKAQVHATGSFIREKLVDSTFSLHEVCESLFTSVISIAKSNTQPDTVNLINDMSRKMQETMATLMKEMETNIAQNLNVVANSKKNDMPKMNEVKHVLTVENKDDGEKFTQQKWNEVVSSNISKKLKEIPVEKTVISKEGKGCVFFPSKEAQNTAKQALENDFKVVSSTKSKRSLLPKLKLIDLDTDVYNTKEVLKSAILEKNADISQMITNGSGSFDIVLIDSVRKYAIAKVSANVRSAILKKTRLFLGMSSLKVIDHFHPFQCFSCQKFGHRQGSHECLHTGTNKHTCLYCAGDHLSKECENKKKPECHKCANCLSSTLERHRKNANHTSTSFHCPHFLKETNLLIKRTIGVENEESNLLR